VVYCCHSRSGENSSSDTTKRVESGDKHAYAMSNQIESININVSENVGICTYTHRLFLATTKPKNKNPLPLILLSRRLIFLLQHF
jgi:hypothetical protein